MIYWLQLGARSDGETKYSLEAEPDEHHGREQEEEVVENNQVGWAGRGEPVLLPQTTGWSAAGQV